MNRIKVVVSAVVLILITTSANPLLAAAKKDPPKNEDPRAAQLRKQASGRWENDPVDISIEKGVKHLFANQNPDGSFGKDKGDPRHYKNGVFQQPGGSKWKSPALRARVLGTLKLKGAPRKHSVGMTAVCVYALLKSGVSIKDSRVKKGLEFLKTYDTCNIYSIGLRCNAYVAAEKYEKGQYMKYLEHDAVRLIYSIHKSIGGWNYSVWEDTYHNSPSQYGILGIWGYQMLGGEIPSKFWPLAVKYWINGQMTSGGWAYQPRFKGGGGHHAQTSGSMSSAGLASMFVCVDAMSTKKYAGCAGGILPKTIVNGLSWFDREFTNTMIGKTPSGRFNYYLYGVERVGRACGYKYFGNQDWYKIGTLTLLKKQNKQSGAWGGDLSESAFALLFLARGRHPVLFNKLDFGGDWNNRPRDIANLTRWMSRNYEQEFNWQNVNIQVDPFEWHDAPILFISGCNKPVFNDEQIKKLRTYVYEGGTIFSVTECGGGKGFKDGIREVYKKAFPRYELAKIDAKHPVYSSHAKLNGTPPMYIMTNGVRPLIIHTDTDVAKDWQLRSSHTKKNTFLFGVNLSRYIVGRYTSLLKRGQSYWPYPVDVSKMKKYPVARVKYKGNYNPEPLALEALSRNLAWDEKTALEVKIVELAQLPSAGVKVAFMTGTDGYSPSAAEKAAIKKFVEGGGTLVVDAAGGKKNFYIAMHKALREAFGTAAVKPLSGNSKYYMRPSSPIKNAKYRVASKDRVQSNAVRLQGVKVGDRDAVVISREDLTAGQVGFQSGVVDGYMPATAYGIVRNIVMTAIGKYQDTEPKKINEVPAGAKNIAKDAKATSPDGLKPDGGGKEADAAIDGDVSTFWDEEDNNKNKPYIIKLEFKNEKNIRAISINGFQHHKNAPKDFKIFINGKQVGKEFKNVQYKNNLVVISLIAEKVKTLELKITASHGKSPGISELGVYE